MNEEQKKLYSRYHHLRGDLEDLYPVLDVVRQLKNSEYATEVLETRAKELDEEIRTLYNKIFPPK